MVLKGPVAGQAQVELGNWITRRMTWLPSCEILNDEPDPNLLALGFVEFGVGEGGSAL
jgi:hypothetical protein